MLILIFGNVGVGKTTLAKALSKKLHYELVHFDEIVKLAFPKIKIYGKNDTFTLGYGRIQKTYHCMEVLAAYLLQQKKNVVLESVYFKKNRDEVVRMAERAGETMLLVHVTCTKPVAKKRLHARKRANEQSAGYKIHLEYDKRMGVEEREHIVIDTTETSTREGVNLIARLVR
jgi:predicted kinase